MAVTGSLARAARALVQAPSDHAARLAALEDAALADFETGRADLDDDAKARLPHLLQEGGPVFLPEEGAGGVGVRLTFTAGDVRAINRMEGEGGPVGSGDA